MVLLPFERDARLRERQLQKRGEGEGAGEEEGREKEKQRKRKIPYNYGGVVFLSQKQCLLIISAFSNVVLFLLFHVPNIIDH